MKSPMPPSFLPRSSMPPVMPPMRPSIIDLPASDSQEPAPEKKPTILSLMPLTLLTASSTPFLTDSTMPENALVTPDLTASHALEKNVLMLLSTEPMELARPLSVETMNAWMPPRMPETVV